MRYALVEFHAAVLYSGLQRGRVELWCARQIRGRRTADGQTHGRRERAPERCTRAGVWLSAPRMCRGRAARRWVKVGVWANVKANVLTGRGVITNCRSLYTFSIRLWGTVARRTRRAGDRVRVRDGELETCCVIGKWRAQE